MQTVPQGSSTGSQAYPDTPGAGTGSSGGVNPGGFNPAGGVTPGGGPSPETGVIPGETASPGAAHRPGKSQNSRNLSAPERARRRKKAATADKDFDCSRMESWTDQVSESASDLTGRNPKSRFCCTGGPPISGIWDGIFYTKSPGKFITLRTNCIDCKLTISVIIRNQAPS